MVNGVPEELLLQILYGAVEAAWCYNTGTPVTTILCLFYNVTYNIEVYPHSVNWTHSPFSLQITQTPCSNINNATDLAPS